MIVCPICQFQNPAGNKFCQQCGICLITPAPEGDTFALQNTCDQGLPMLPLDRDAQQESPVSPNPTDMAPTKLLAPDTSHNNQEDAPTHALASDLARLEAAAKTDRGRQREHNEDFFIVRSHLTQVTSSLGEKLKARGLYILCDGMGGHANGEVASSLAATTLEAYFQHHWQQELPDQASLLEAIHRANQAIYTLNQQSARTGSSRMGTTLVIVLVEDTQVRVAHIGDSRLYRLTASDSLESLTLDHVVGPKTSPGAASETTGDRANAYQLAQALGPRPSRLLKPEIQTFTVDQDTLLILSSDGLSDNHFLETHSTSHLQPLLTGEINLEKGLTQLVDLANSCNGHDNITVVAVRILLRAEPL